MLQSSTGSSHSRSQTPPAAQFSSSRSTLEAFIAHHPAPLSYSPQVASSSRSPQTSPPDSADRRRTRIADSHSPVEPRCLRFSTDTLMDTPPRTRQLAAVPASRLSAHTPRKRSVELAPDNSAVFAEEARALEEQAGVELDIDDSIADLPWDEEVDGSRLDEQLEDEEVNVEADVAEELELVEEESQRRSFERAARNESVNSANRSGDRSRRFYSRSPSQPSPEDDSLPPLPEPSLDSSEDDSKFHTISSRQSLFPSPSKTPARSANSSRSFASTTRFRHLSRDVSQSSPSARYSTPVKEANVTLSGQPTPHPPGWYTTGKSKTVRTSPRQVEEASPVAIHKLKLSPAKPKSPRKFASPQSPERKEEEVDEGNSSFLGRIPVISKLITKSSPRTSPLPPSTVLQTAREALSQASQTSRAAQTRVEVSQRQFLEALAAAQNATNSAVIVARRGWDWGNWVWWMGVELLLVWGVFR